MLREMPPTGTTGDAPGDAAGGISGMLREMQLGDPWRMLPEMLPTGIPGDALGAAAVGSPWMPQEMQLGGTPGDAPGTTNRRLLGHPQGSPSAHKVTSSTKNIILFPFIKW